MAASDSKLSFARDTRPTWRTVLPTGYEPQKTHVPVGRFHANDGYLPLFPDPVHLSVNDTGRRDPKSSRALRSTSGTCCTHMSKVATMEGIADPSGNFNLAGTEQGWCFGFKCETGRDGTDSRVDVQDGQHFSWGNKPRGRKGRPSRNPIPSRQPQPRADSA